MLLLLCAAIVAGAAPPANLPVPPGLSKVWELDLDRAIPKCLFQEGFRTPVQAIRFSPPGDFLAAGVGECPKGETAQQSLIVVPLSRPAPRILASLTQAGDVSDGPEFARLDLSPDRGAISS